MLIIKWIVPLGVKYGGHYLLVQFVKNYARQSTNTFLKMNRLIF